LIVFYGRASTQAWQWKFAGLLIELVSAVLIFGLLLDFSLKCLMELPTGPGPASVISRLSTCAEASNRRRVLRAGRRRRG